MKYIISKNQQEKLSKIIDLSLKQFFLQDSQLICDIKCYVVDETEPGYDGDGLLFDIYIKLKLSEMKRFNHLGQRNIQVAIENRVEKLLKDFFSLQTNQFFIGFLSETCD